MLSKRVEEEIKLCLASVLGKTKFREELIFGLVELRFRETLTK